MIVELKTWEVGCDQCPTRVKVVAAEFELPAGWTQDTERGLVDEERHAVELCPTCTAAKAKTKPGAAKKSDGEDRTWGAPWEGANFDHDNVAL